MSQSQIRLPLDCCSAYTGSNVRGGVLRLWLLLGNGHGHFRLVNSAHRFSQSRSISGAFGNLDVSVVFPLVFAIVGGASC